MKDLIILGAGGAGWDIVSLVKAINNIQPEWNILGFLDDNKDLYDKSFCGVKIIGTIDDALHYPNAYFISSIANPNNRIIRRRIWDRVKAFNLQFACLIHPSVVLYEDVCLSEGCVINANCVIGTGAIIGEDVHFGYACNIAHEVKIEAHTSFGTGVNISSGVDIGSDCYIGAGVTTTHDVKIENDTLIAIGSAVPRNLNNGTHGIWIGVPVVSEETYIRHTYMLKKISKKKK